MCASVSYGPICCTAQALSISRSLSKAKIDAETGQLNSKSLRDAVIREITESSGRIDYAEVRPFYHFLT